jgi:signal peptidase
MEPKIHTGSVVVVLPVKDYKIGNIITFGPYSKTEPPTTHRIADIKVNGNQPVYITKGDANDSADSREVARKDIEGKVLFSIPYFGFIISFIRKPLGFILLIIIPAMIMLLDEIRKIIKEIKTKKSQSQNV